MTHRKTMLSASIVAALMFAASAQAQNAEPQSDTGEQSKTQKRTVQELQAVQVVGISASLQQSLQIKRSANSIVDAVTSEDLGKFPNTDVAEAMTQIPGVTIDRIFGQGSSVSINGVAPNLNLTFLNGHQVAQMSWLGSGQSRGFDFSILPPELVGNVVVYKSAQAKLPEGSVGGSIMVHTREPLDLPANTVAGSIGATYNEQYGEAKPKGALMYSWKNDEGTFGVLVSLSRYEEQIDRQGVEIFGYSPVKDLVNVPGTANSDAVYPSEVNAAWFQQHRKRTTGNFAIQFKPTDNLLLGLHGLYLHENYNNSNQSMYAFAAFSPANVDAIGPVKNGVVSHLHVCGNVFSSTCANPAAAQGQAVTMLDSDPRVSSMTIKGMYLTAEYDRGSWGVRGQVGFSTAVNPDTQTFADEGAYAGGYTLDINNGVTFDDPAAARDPSNWLMGGQNGSATFTIGRAYQYNRLNNLQIDFHNDFDGVFNELDYGYRHNENYVRVTPSGFAARGPQVQVSEADVGVDGYTDILDQFSGFSSDMRHRIHPSVDDQIAFQKGLDYDELASSVINGKYVAQEKTDALYIQQNFQTYSLSGNFGVRYVRTKTTASAYQPTGPAVLPAPPEWWKTSHSSYDLWLPSFNISYTPTTQVTLRLAASKVMARQTIANEVPTLGLNASTLPPTGSGGNPDLLPYEANVYMASAEWNFAPQAAVGIEAFFLKIKNYVLQVPQLETHFTEEATTAPQHFQELVKLGYCDAATNTCQFNVSRPQNKGAGKVRGLGLSYQQAYGSTGLGLISSFTYSDGESASGGPLPFNSKYAVNFSPYYEKGPFSLRLTYTWRSKYFTAGYQVGAPVTFVDDYAELDATTSWAFDKHWSVSLSALNLTDERYFQYDIIKAKPANRYYNGTRYMATLHVKF